MQEIRTSSYHVRKWYIILNHVYHDINFAKIHNIYQWYIMVRYFGRIASSLLQEVNYLREVY